MENLTLIDYLFLYSLISIWLVLLINILLATNGYMYYMKINKIKIQLIEDKKCPFVSILVPAHNEEKVIYKTVRALLLLNYPKDKMELIVINDNSNDNTAEELKKAKKEFPNYNFTIITTDSITGGKGKSNALNLGYKKTKGEYIAVYDADNTTEKNALKYLITRIHNDKTLGAVIGKFRTRNRDRNVLTKFINIETLSFQWMAQAGRWNLLKLCTIPGTNFVIKKSILKRLGGWDEKAISEDTEISFRIYKIGYKIAFMPLAVTWEQEPETIRVWFKQRTRWAKGNIYVLNKYLIKIFKEKPSKILFDVMYFFLVYFLFLSSVLISDGIFILSIFTNLKTSINGNLNILWILAYILFILEVAITLTMEKGQGTFKNVILIPIMYFTYCQMWLIVAVNSFIQYIKDIVLKREVKWYKTERF
ncbi:MULTISPECIES: glycosyltransferase [Clostridium]|uniref:Glycosyltransferase family 2 protein n=1 Tax=Clostridium senegalense TaxID=1465809 RepID=A0A6M0GZ16_9CLOT|nr:MULTISPECIES: glycosyltransferase [Clostridium]NEU03740.1 glycosyltransferase family 2 protein [Clostridium senegalense]